MYLGRCRLCGLMIVLIKALYGWIRYAGLCLVFLVGHLEAPTIAKIRKEVTEYLLELGNILLMDLCTFLNHNLILRNILLICIHL